MAFLAAVTVAVLLVRAGLDGSGTSGPATTASAPATTAPRAARTPPAETEAPRPRKRLRKRFYTIKRGDTLDAVAIRFGTTVGDLLELNPGIDPTSLTIGQKVRVK